MVELSAAPWCVECREKRRYRLPARTPILPPCEPSKIVCVGKNYPEHVRELHPDEPVPAEPLLFLKPASALLAPGEAIVLPPQSSRVDFEGELAVVVGKMISWKSLADLEGAVFGYTVANDVTARDLQQRDGQWTRAKGFDTFCPVGPLLSTDMDGEVMLITRLNGEERQRVVLGQMTFSVCEIVRYIAEVMTLYPGDLILTGTPAGVGQLQAGDIVEVEIQGLGKLRNAVKAREIL